ncbi:MAG: cation-transporting P-type ATPase [Myxococcota bacterium]|nr:cation-transporting P-type ATPase [Myxococcota bacterium]
MLVLPLGDDLGSGRVVRHHRAARRLRLEVRGLIGRPDRARRLEASLARDGDGVEEVRADPRSGRVLLRYRPGAALLERLEDAGRRRPRRAAQRRDAERLTGPWHAWELDAVWERLEASRAGLSRGEAARRLKRFGPNYVEDGAPRSRFEVLLDQVSNFPTALLLGSSAFAALVRELLDAGAILGTVSIDALIGYRLERKNEDLLASWRRLEAGTARVLRGGHIFRVPAADLVPGDVLVCRAGDTVAADARVLDTHRLACDEAFLTGESEPRAKQSHPVEADAPLAEHDSMVFAGARVVSGRGRAVVTGTGERTAAARVRRLVERERSGPTPFERRLDELGRKLSVMGALSGVGAAGAAVLRGQTPVQAIRSAVALGVAAVPEGLPLVATTGLVQSMQRMRERGMIVRRLVSAETLGGVTVVCADKTGTLTQNDMRLEVLDLGGRAIAATELRADPEKVLDDPVTLALAAAVLNTDVDVHHGPEARSIAGSATERAIVSCAYEAGLERGELRRAFPRRLLRERGGNVHYVLSLHEAPGDGLVAFVKGAPEQVVELCAGDLAGPLDEAGRRALIERNHALAADGLRVLALAWRRVEDETTDALRSGFTLIGLLGLRDPLRSDAADVVQAAARAGIRTLILTGDQQRTGAATARLVGLEGDAIDGAEIARLLAEDPPAARARLRSIAAITRVDPAQKAAVVKALREMGEVVAMAGDGINDAPALKAADVGIAIGDHASDVSRQAADIVLASEELGAVLAAVGEGRIVQDNLRRAIRYLLATNFAEVALTLGSTLVSRQAPFTPMRLLWLNLISDALPAIALALEPGRGDEITRPPAPPETPLVGPEALRQMVRDGLLMTGAGALALRLGGPAVAFSAFAGAELGYALACRSTDTAPDPPFIGLLGGTAALHVGAMLMPPVRALLALPPVPSPLELGAFFAGAALPVVVPTGGRDVRIVRSGRREDDFDQEEVSS